MVKVKSKVTMVIPSLQTDCEGEVKDVDGVEVCGKNPCREAGLRIVDDDEVVSKSSSQKVSKRIVDDAEVVGETPCKNVIEAAR